jgi:pentapeptide repeat protein
MANQEHLDLLKQGSSAWNAWRVQHKEVRPDLRQANLSKADLSEANLSKAYLVQANLIQANLSRADLVQADLSGANLSGADLSGANLIQASLNSAFLIRTNLANTTLKDCSIYGISAWDVQLDGAEQLNLTITPYDQPIITVDNLKIAQFIYLLLNNKEIRDVINTLTTKSVLILGRFTPERKAVLDALREALRQHNYLPILFDFDPANTQTVRETVRTLAHLSHFIIADLTNHSSIPEELETIVPTLAVPIQPLLEATQKREFSMFKGYGVYDWVLPIYRYADLTGLLDNVQEKVIEPATQKARELEAKKVRLNQEPFEQTT